MQRAPEYRSGLERALAYGRVTAALLVTAGTAALVTRVEFGRTLVNAIFPLVIAAVAAPLFLYSERGSTRLARPRRRKGSAGRTQPAELPPSPQPIFGREAELKLLLETLARRVNPRDRARRDERPALAVLIWGHGGMGKTALAMTFSSAARKRFHDGHLYLNPGASGVKSPSEALRLFLRTLGIPTDGALNLRDMRRRYLSLTRKKSLLVVLDDIEDVAWLDALWPSGPGCAILVTSRERLGAPFDLRLELKRLRPPADLNLLEEIIGAARTRTGDAYMTECFEVLRVCNGNPLTIRLTGQALAMRPHLDLSVAVDRLRHLQASDGRASAGDGSSLDIVVALMADQEREIVRGLGLLPAKEGFAPWMLAAICGVDEGTASRLTERMAHGGLVERVPLPVSSDKSYLVGELVRTYAESRRRLTTSTDYERDAATRLDRARAERREARPFKLARGEFFHEYQTGEFTEALRSAYQALAVADVNNDIESRALALSALAELHGEIGGIDDARDFALDAIGGAVESAEGRAERVLGKIERRLRHGPLSRRHLKKALEIAIAIGDPEEEFRCRRELIILASVDKRAARGDLELDNTKRLMDTLGDAAAQHQSGLLWAEAQLLARDHLFVEARSKLAAASGKLVQGEQRLWAAWISYSRGVVEAHLIETKSAQASLNDALNQFGVMRHRYGVGLTRLELGKVLCQEGRLGQARALFEEAIQSFRICGDGYAEGAALGELARLVKKAGAGGSTAGTEADLLSGAAARAYIRTGHPTLARRAGQQRPSKAAEAITALSGFLPQKIETSSAARRRDDL